LFGPAFIKGVATGIGTAVTSKITSLVSGKGAKEAAKKAAGAASAAADAAKATQQLRQAGDVAGAAGALGERDKKLAGPGVFKKLMSKFLAIAAMIVIGGVAIAIAIVLMKKILDAGGIKTVDDAIVPLVLLGAMVLATLPLMLAAKMADKIGPGAMKGLLFISLAVAAIGLVGAGIVWLIKETGATPEVIVAAGELMGLMSLVFLAMVPLLMGAAIVGATVLSIFGGISMLAGMAAITAAVLSITGTAKFIIDELNKMDIQSDFQIKVDAFLKVMQSIQAFTDSIVSIFQLMKPSFIELLKGQTFQTKVDAAIRLLDALIGKKGEGKGIIGVVELVIEQLKALPTDEKIQKSAELMSNVMTSVTALLEAVKPPDSYIEALDSVWNQLTGIDDDIQKKVTEYVKEHVGHVKDLTKEMKTAIDELSKVSVPDENKAKSITQIYSSLATMIKNIVPDAEFIKVWHRTSKSHSQGGQMETSGIDYESLNKFIQTYFAQIGPLVGTLSSEPLNAVIVALNNTDVKKLEKMSGFVDVLSAVAELVKAIAGLHKEPDLKDIKSNSQSTLFGQNSVVVNITNAVPDIVDTIERIGKLFGPLVDAMTTAVSKVPNTKDFKTKIDNTKSMFAMLTEIPSLAQAILDPSTGLNKRGLNVEESQKGGFFDQLSTGQIDPLTDAISTINGALTRLTSSGQIDEFMKNVDALGSKLSDKKNKNFSSTVKTVQTFFDTVKGVTESLSKIQTEGSSIDPSTIYNNMGYISEAIKSITGEGGPVEQLKANLTEKVVQDVAAASGSLKRYGTHMKTIATTIEEGGVGQGLTAISDMFTKINALNDALKNGLSNVNLDAKLKTLASNMGLGKNLKYKIESKEVVLNINLAVSINAADMEKALILRKDSIIRDRFNEFGYNPQGQVQTISENQSDVPKVFQMSVP